MLFQKHCCQPKKLGNLRERNQGRENNLLEIQDPAWSSNLMLPHLWFEWEMRGLLVGVRVLWDTLGFSSMVARKKFLSPVRIFPSGFSVVFWTCPASRAGWWEPENGCLQGKSQTGVGIIHSRGWRGPFPGFPGGSGLPRGITSFIRISKFFWQVDGTTHASGWVKKSEAPAASHLPAGMLSIFPSLLRGEMGQRTSHQGRNPPWHLLFL